MLNAHCKIKCYIVVCKMSNLNADVVDEIVKKCLYIYMILPKNGKPVEKEWTVLSCVLQYDKVTSSIEVVSLGTGTKCIGATKMSPAGDLLNDSHAEVIARRGFLVYLYDNMSKALEMKNSILTLENCKFKLKDNIEFIFYSSQLPCGDAAIMPVMPKSVDEEHYGKVVNLYKRQAEEDFSEISVKKQKLDSDDIHRTGAKCLPNNEQDLKCAGTNYHVLGQVRTKPGRGDRTLSVSCSDKIARWLHLGIQGALIDMLVTEPIYLAHFIFGGGVPYSAESLKRAFLRRNFKSSPIVLDNVPNFYQSSIVFPHVKNESNKRAAPGSIIWINLNNMVSEVAVQGRKLGLTRQKAISPDNSLCISKYNLYKKFHQILLKHEMLRDHLELDLIRGSPLYNETKRKSNRYREKWKKVRETFFKIWTVKPDIWNFYIKCIKT